MNQKEPTVTYLVEQALRACGCPISVTGLAQMTGQPRGRIHSALKYLYNHKCANSKIYPNGVRYWYALTPELDTRTKRFDNRAPELKDRARRWYRKRGAKEPTATSLVEETLRQANDFMSINMLMAATKQPYRRVHAALYHLHKYHCVEAVIEANGTSWWFALPQEMDQRTKHILERVPESKPRNRRRKPKEMKNV